MTANHAQNNRAALQFYIDNGVDVAVSDAPRNYYSDSSSSKLAPKQASNVQVPENTPSKSSQSSQTILGASEARDEAVKLSSAASTLDELREAVQSFDGITLKQTATNMVFCDGNPEAPIMLVGEAPGTDEDRAGKPFVGVNGQLLDRILACIDIDRTDESAKQSIYISNIINWRPPGNRTPNPGEIEASLPFIERHIQLVKPKILIFCGGVAAKSLLGRSEGISRLRNQWHDYLPQTPELQKGVEAIPAIATFHPAYLLQTPVQKRAVWADMISIHKKREELGLV